MIEYNFPPRYLAQGVKLTKYSQEVFSEKEKKNNQQIT